MSVCRLARAAPAARLVAAARARLGRGFGDCSSFPSTAPPDVRAVRAAERAAAAAISDGDGSAAAAFSAVVAMAEMAEAWDTDECRCDFAV